MVMYKPTLRFWTSKTQLHFYREISYKNDLFYTRFENYWMMSEQTSTMKNMLKRFWDFVQNMIRHGPVAVLRVLWKLILACGRAGMWIARMTGLMIWRSFWWTVGSILRARGVKAVEAKTDRRITMDSDESSSDESSCSTSSMSSASSGTGRKVRNTMHQRTARSGAMVGAAIKNTVTGEEWGYITGETRDRMAWKLNTGKVVRKDSKKWKCVDTVKRNFPQRSFVDTAPRKVTVGSAEEAVSMLRKHKGGRPIEITVRSPVE